MKKTILFIIWVICIFSAGKASAQTYFNYALTYLDTSQSDSHGIIRAIYGSLSGNEMLLPGSCFVH